VVALVANHNKDSPTLPETVLWSGYGEIRAKGRYSLVKYFFCDHFKFFIYTDIKLLHLITRNSNNF
jgi:hypothetical protein